MGVVVTWYTIDEIIRTMNKQKKIKIAKAIWRIKDEKK